MIAIEMVVDAIHQSNNVPVKTEADGAKLVSFTADPGLYQFSLFLDAARFDWESLYQVLNVHQNVNERTGPWDFDLMTARPLVPSYWIYLDGEKLGLWYVQRVSLEDVANKRFRGRFAFDVRSAGAHELKLAPFRPAQVEWLAARLESDPEDRLDWSVQAVRPVSALPVAAWARPEFWELQKRKLETTHQAYRAPLQALFDWVRKGGAYNYESIPALVAAWRMDGQAAARDKALAIVDEMIALPAWGRPAEDVYGHNGDIGGAAMLRSMAWAYHMIGDDLGAARRERLLKKLAYQGEVFWVQILLMRDYWGGSLLQDHGRKAVHDFGTAAMCMWGVVPEADRWVAYLVPRIQRGLDAAPLDGVIPGSSYFSLSMYTDPIMFYRDLLLARTDLDLAAHPSLRDISAFVLDTVDEDGSGMLETEQDRIPLAGGALFAETMASKRRDAAAADLSRLLLRHYKEALEKFPVPASSGILWGFLAHDPAIHALASPPRKAAALTWYRDSGFVHYRNADAGVALSVKCGPWLGYHASSLATGPCDMMEVLPGAGHFSLFLKGRPMMASPDTGYSLHSAVRSILLIDGQGQIGDVGYPMSIPSQPPRGVHVEQVMWNEAAGTGIIRLDLKAAYPAELGVTHYTREFHVESGRRISCRDYVVLSQPRKLSWLFQFREDEGGRLDGLKAVVGTDPALRLAASAPGLELSASIAQTKVVYSYSSAFKRFRHVQYDTLAKATNAAVDFVFEW
jgi:hypothetical protein